MNRQLVAALSGLSLLVLPQVAPAQVSTNQYRETLVIAQCLIEKQNQDALALLAAVPETAAAAELFERLTSGKSGCASAKDGRQFRRASIRGAIAERAYLAAYPAPPAEAPAAPPAFVADPNPELVSYEITRCAALRDPVGADMLVRSELRSTAEATALGRLMPVLGSCVARGGKPGFDRETMRGMIAEGLYELRQAQTAA